jgi:hypothetical protein
MNNVSMKSIDGKGDDSKMKTQIEMQRRANIRTVIIYKDDLTDYAIQLGIWEALTEGLGRDIEEVEVIRVAPKI